MKNVWIDLGSTCVWPWDARVARGRGGRRGSGRIPSQHEADEPGQARSSYGSIDVLLLPRLHQRVSLQAQRIPHLLIAILIRSNKFVLTSFPSVNWLARRTAVSVLFHSILAQFHDSRIPFPSFITVHSFIFCVLQFPSSPLQVQTRSSSSHYSRSAFFIHFSTFARSSRF